MVILKMSKTERMQMNSEALKTDHYELTMLEAALQSGVAHHRAVFEVFARKLPTGRRYGVLGGVGRIVEAIKNFNFGPEEMEFLRSRGFLKESTLEYLANYRFTGSVFAYPEGELYFPYSPVLTVEATFGEGVLLETLILSMINSDSAVGSAASRMVLAAEGRPLIEMGSRRTHEDAAISAARIATALGFGATSNLEAGRRWGTPTKGTSAHAFTLAHAGLTEDNDEAERIAFKAQIEALGVGTTLLVDTFDIERGIENAISVAGVELGGIRIDSGDLAYEARKARKQLDELGAKGTKIVISGDLDEYSISELVSTEAPIDVFGVGTRLVVGSGHPTASFVYKLVAISDKPEGGLMRPVAKKSASKASNGGKKWAKRVLENGKAIGEIFGNDPESVADVNGRLLQQQHIQNGKIALSTTAATIKANHDRAVMELPEEARQIGAGEAAFIAEEKK